MLPTHLLSVVCSVFPMPLRTTWSGLVPPTVGWALPLQSLIMKMLPQACLRANLKKAFSQLWLSLLSLYQVDQKNQPRQRDSTCHPPQWMAWTKSKPYLKRKVNEQQLPLSSQHRNDNDRPWPPPPQYTQPQQPPVQISQVIS